MIDLKKLIDSANNLAPLPASTVRLAQMVSSSNCDLGEVSELIAFDQGLTMSLLRGANSAASGGAMVVSTVQEAVSRLGLARVLALAVASGARPFLSGKLEAYQLDEGALWRHSVASAVAAEVIPGYCEVEIPSEVFTAAILHDVGKLVMSRFLDPEIIGYIRRAQEVDGLPRLEAESMLLGVHHGELGGLIAQHWALPHRVVQGIIHHHHPEQGGDVVCDATYLANIVGNHIEACFAGKDLELLVESGVCERLGVTQANLQALCPIAAARFAQVSNRYNAAA
ncbi:MAG: HDOD domain-containing protein [Opitutaceae bacterium]|nr:HDOD domain-containing protein [Opitutaceae bacterium]